MLRPVVEATISVSVNGKIYSAPVSARLTLADFLRDHLELTGTHVGCEHGVCGACTVLIDGTLARSCLTLAVQVDNAQVTTVEGLADGENLHPLQRAFQHCHGLQCGFCTPGFLMTAYALLKETPDPTEDEIREFLSGNLCRCTGYRFIIDAVQFASRELRTGTSS